MRKLKQRAVCNCVLGHKSVHSRAQFYPRHPDSKILALGHSIIQPITICPQGVYNSGGQTTRKQTLLICRRFRKETRSKASGLTQREIWPLPLAPGREPLKPWHFPSDRGVSIIHSGPLGPLWWSMQTDGSGQGLVTGRPTTLRLEPQDTKFKLGRGGRRGSRRLSWPHAHGSNMPREWKPPKMLDSEARVSIRVLLDSCHTRLLEECHDPKIKEALGSEPFWPHPHTPLPLGSSNSYHAVIKL